MCVSEKIEPLLLQIIIMIISFVYGLYKQSMLKHHESIILYELHELVLNIVCSWNDYTIPQLVYSYGLHRMIQLRSTSYKTVALFSNEIQTNLQTQHAYIPLFSDSIQQYRP